MEQTQSKPNLLIEIAKRKAEAQKNGANVSAGSFSKFQSGKDRRSQKGLLGPSRGGRNGQGKP